jgi:hypothetical protein
LQLQAELLLLLIAHQFVVMLLRVRGHASVKSLSNSGCHHFPALVAIGARKAFVGKIAAVR